jgi:cell division septum initiation protein DivIVA
MAPENKLRLSTAMPTEPTFTVMFRGYNRREVDQYAQLAESQLAAAVNERQELAARVQNLADQLAQANTELVELRRRPGPNDKLNFRHLGPRVEQILAEAERQADAVRMAAVDGVAQERDRLKADLAKSREDHERSVREFENSMQTRRSEEEKAITKRLEAVRTEVSDAQAHASRLRSEADLALAAAQSEAQRVTAAAAAAAEKLRTETTENALAIRTKAEHEAAAVANAAETYARQTREEAESQAHQTRAQAEQHAHQTMSGAEQSAKQLRQQAEEQAAQVRLQAEKHAARVYSGPGGIPLNVTNKTDGAAPTSPAVGTNETPAAEGDGAAPRHRANVRAQPTG